MESLRSVDWASRSFGTTMRASLPLRSHVYVSVMSSTTPVCPSTVTTSPRRRGCVTARTTPAIALASTCREAKPTTAATMADDASTVPARRCRSPNWATASVRPTSRSAATTTRRRKRRRVSACGLRSTARRASRSTRRAATARPTVMARTIAAPVIPPVSAARMAPGMGADRSRDAGPAAVLLDAMGTLVELLPPAPRLVAALAAHGVAVAEDEARTAMGAEIAFYRAHLHGARDAATLAALRRRCAAVLGDALPPAAAALGPDALLEALLGALRFRAYPEVPGVLRELRGRGTRLVVVSNWDASLQEMLRATGLTDLVDGAVASAELGAAK